MKTFLLLSSLVICNMAMSQYTLILNKKRPPINDYTAYKQIAVGDIVGPLGSKTENSLELTDELTSKLFNSKTFEILDRNALADILNSQKRSDVTLINESTAAALGKKLHGALLIVGRLQNEVITQTQQTERNGTTTCGSNYWWEAKYELTVQLKVIDLKTGSMIYSQPVTYTRNAQSEKSCTLTKKFDRETLAMQAIPNLATEITKVLIAYDEELQLVFMKPSLSVFSNPLKKTEDAVAYLQVAKFEEGLAILKDYAQGGKIKGATLGKAVYNYGLGLLAASQYDAAAAQFKQSTALGLANDYPMFMLQQIDKEKTYERKFAKK